MEVLAILPVLIASVIRIHLPILVCVGAAPARMNPDVWKVHVGIIAIIRRDVIASIAVVGLVHVFQPNNLGVGVYVGM